MDQTNAVACFSALAHGHRLAVVELLKDAGVDGLPAGVIAQSLKVAPSTLSAHLSQLERAKILVSQRRHRNVYYALNRSELIALSNLIAGLGTEEDAAPRLKTVV